MKALRDDSRPRKYKWRYGPLRLVMPWLCIGVGAVMAFRDASPLMFGLGLGLVALGVLAFFFYRWMSRRGI
jgi:hypothetical protein